MLWPRLVFIIIIIVIINVTLRMLILTSKLLKEPFISIGLLMCSFLLNGKYSSLTHCERYLIFLFLVIFLVMFSHYLSKNAIDFENSFFFFYSK